MKTILAFLLLCTTLSAQALRSEWRSQYDLGMRPNSRTQSAMDANEDAIESVWSQMKTRKGRVVLGPEGYWIDSPIVSYLLDGQSLFGTGGMGLYVSENGFGGGVNSATGGSYSRIVAGADDMAALLDITGYGWRIQDVMFAGNWSQNGSTGWRLAADEPTTGIKIHSNPGSVLAANRANPSGPATLFGTGKMIFDGLCFYKLKNGITFGGDNPNTVDGYTEENNADNCHFTRTEGQFLSEAIYRFKSPQSVVFTADQTHSCYCSQVAYFERGGHADLGFIEVIEGPTSGSRSGLGTIVLHLGDTRENENWYKLHARLDPTAKKTGLKVVQMDYSGFGTTIDCRTVFGYSFSNSAPAPPTDIFDIKGATTLILSGGPYYADCIKCVDASSGTRRPHIVFLPGTVFHTNAEPYGAALPADCINTATSTGNWSVKWSGCCTQNGVPIVDGEATN